MRLFLLQGVKSHICIYIYTQTCIYTDMRGGTASAVYQCLWPPSNEHTERMPSSSQHTERMPPCNLLTSTLFRLSS